MFRIGLSPLGDAPWLERDARLPVYLAEKARLLAECRDEVFGAEAGSEAAQAEVLALISDALGVAVAGDEPPLITAARLIAEDLAILSHDADGWRLVAGVICFPSSWRLPDKLGKVLHAVHAPVPGFSEGTRKAGMIERIFDNLAPDQPVLRWNYSLYGDRVLHHPHLSAYPRFGGEIVVRVERQVLRKLAVSGDMVFSIGVHLVPLEDLRDHPERAALVGALKAQVEALTAEELAYKGLAAEKAQILRRLEGMDK